MNNADYVKKMINDGTIFYVVECDKQLVSAASADANQTFHHAELTDCATLPEHRKYGLMKKLLIHLENDLRINGIYCAFSIARSLSFGMNAAFYQLGYQYTGRLTNNCYIFDKLEDMNVWVKDLSGKTDHS
jgi:putative beta-lysine N-acetyltransferase